MMRRTPTMSDRQPVIVFALFPGVTQLDFTGPHQVFSSLPGADVILASAEGGAIESTGGMTFAGLRRLAAIPECDVVCVTGGRVTAGIDFALSVVAELTDSETAQAIQLQIEYAPAPPFDAGLPETAPPAILARVRERISATAAQRRAAVESAAARLAAS